MEKGDLIEHTVDLRVVSRTFERFEVFLNSIDA